MIQLQRPKKGAVFILKRHRFHIRTNLNPIDFYGFGYLNVYFHQESP